MKRCARCQAAILFTEMVMRARDLVFHVHCFTCAVCNSTFNKGDQFGLKDGTVLCQIHYELAVSEEHHQSPSPATFPGGGTYPPPFPSPEFHPHHHHASIPPSATPVCPDSVVGNKVPYFNGTATGTARQKGRPRKRKPKDLETMTANLGIWITCFLFFYFLSFSFFFLLCFLLISLSLFHSLKILSTPSFGGEVKPSVPCRRFAACKRSLNGVEVVISAKLPDNILAHSSTFRRWDLLRRGGRGGTWWRKWERLNAGKSNGKLPLRTFPGCSLPEPYQSPD